MHSLDFLEISTTETPNSSVIWLHGLGADGHNFEDLVTQLQLPQKLGIRFIFPHAPIRPISINGGYPMRAWFDILGLDENAIQDESGIRKSEQLIAHLIDKIIKTGIPSQRIIVGGFSQGGALALHFAVRYPNQLGGAIGLSSYIPLAKQVSLERHRINASLPIFLAHGTHDSIVPYPFGQVCYNLLKSLGYPITWREYPIAHTVSVEEINDVSQWLQKNLET